MQYAMARLLYGSWGFAAGVVTATSIFTLYADSITRDACPLACNVECAQRLASGCYVEEREVCTKFGCMPVPLEIKEISIPGGLHVSQSSFVTVIDASNTEIRLTEVAAIECVLDYLKNIEMG